MTQTVPEYGGCPWPVDEGCLDEAWGAFPDDVKARSVALASSVLHRLTGGRVSNCPITVRPCIRLGQPMCFVPFVEFDWATGFHPGIDAAGQWRNSCGCRGVHSCVTGCEVPLPAPVGRVDEVKVNGAVIPATDYMVRGNRLVWMGDGECPWPSNQNLGSSDSEDGTFSVTYINGYPPDALAAYAVAVLAMEFARACTNKGKCRLPSGVTTIVRQGVTMEIGSGAFPDGMTGIREVDTFITLWNPGTLQAAPKVWAP